MPDNMDGTDYSATRPGGLPNSSEIDKQLAGSNGPLKQLSTGVSVGSFGGASGSWQPPIPGSPLPNDESVGQINQLISGGTEPTQDAALGGSGDSYIFDPKK